MKHIAHKMDFETLYSGLMDRVISGHISLTTNGDLHLFCYSRETNFERAWDDFTMAARGLIVDKAAKRIVATPFPKFFNVGEMDQTIPNLEFRTYEKLDGSLIIIYHHNGEWQTATKGSFNSEQASWAKNWMKQRDLSYLIPGNTYLAEAIYPENRIVIHYKEEGLVLLGGYDSEGMELPRYYMEELSVYTGWKISRTMAFKSVSDLILYTKALPASEEGFVIRFENGHRLKVKGDEYKRIHALVSNLTPLAIWESQKNRDDLDALKKDIPEEFWEDFDSMRSVMEGQILRLLGRIENVAGPLNHLSDKEVGLMLKDLPEDVRGFVFPYRKAQGNLLSDSKSREKLYNTIRPTSNRLEGYTPSYTIRRMINEEN